jgi:hypothetical protein
MPSASMMSACHDPLESHALRRDALRHSRAARRPWAPEQRQVLVLHAPVRSARSLAAMTPPRTSPEPAVASAAGPGLGRIATLHAHAAGCGALGDHNQTSLPPSDHTIRLRASSIAGPRARRAGSPPCRPERAKLAAMRRHAPAARSSGAAPGSPPAVARGQTSDAVECIRVDHQRALGPRAGSRHDSQRCPEVTRMPGPTRVAERFSASSATRSAALREKVPSCLAGKRDHRDLEHLRLHDGRDLREGTASVT